MAKIFIGVAWPYANGPIHVGHMAGCNLPPDIFRKFHIMKGNEVLMVSGSDMHGTPVTVRAEKEGLKPEELARKYHLMNVKALDDFGIEFDEFHSTEDPDHIATVGKLFLRLHENGYLYEKEMELPYCEKCDRTLPDRYVEGECPFCHFEKARGDQCEECGKLMDPDTLIAPSCTACGTAPEFVKRDHFFFKLSALEKPLKEWMADKDHWRPHVLNFSRMFLETGLKDRPVTRDTTYGIKIPLPGHDDKRIYVWFEAFMGYYSMAVKWANGDQKKLESFWKNPECRHYYFLGKDNVPFHTIFWPAVVSALEWDLNLPYDVPANAFLRFGGQQFSKSRGVSVSIKDIVAEYDPDAMRYYMAVTMPENRDTDFTWEDFVTRNNSELVATYGNFVHRTLSFTFKNFGEIPEGETEAKEAIERALDEVGQHLEKCEFKRGIKRAMELARFGNQYLDTKAPWKQLKEDREACATTLHTAIHLAKALAIVMAPFLPFSSQRLWETLGESGKISDAAWEDALAAPEPGRKLAEPKPLFEKLEVIVMDERTVKELPAEMGKLDIRIGRIVEVNEHPNADKLIIMTVDLGDEKRQLVAGLKQYYNNEELADKKIVVLCNLQPAKLRGVESQGMLLAAVKGDDVSIMVPEGEAEPGDRLRGMFGTDIISFPDFKKLRMEVGEDGYGEFVGPDGGRFGLHTQTAKIKPDKPMGAGASIQ